MNLNKIVQFKYKFVLQSLYKTRQLNFTTENKSKKGKSKETVYKSKKISNIPMKPQKKSAKSRKIEEEFVLKEESLLTNINSYMSLQKTIVPLQHNVTAIPEAALTRPSKRGKKAKSARMHDSLLDQSKSINEINQKDLLIDKIILGTDHSSDPISGKFICDLLHENPYENYIKNFLHRKVNELFSFENAYNSNNKNMLPVMIDSANGVYVQDLNKFIYLDFASGAYASNFAHNNTQIINIVKPFFNFLPTSIEAFYNPFTSQVTSVLKNFLGFEKINILTTKIDSLFLSFRIALKYGVSLKKNKIIILNENLKSNQSFEKYFIYVPYDNFQKIEEVMKANEIAAVVLEPFLIENGFVIPEDNYLAKVRKICTENKALMIVDESQTCLGTCSGISYALKKQISPDILILGDSLTGSYSPISFTLTHSHLMNLVNTEESECSYSTNPLEIKFAEATIKYLLDNPVLLLNIEAKEGIIASYLYMNNKLIKEIRGRGLFFAIELYENSPVNAYEVSLYLMQKGILTRVLTKNVIAFAPPITVQEGELYKACSIIVNVFKALENFHSEYHQERTTEFNVNPISQAARDIVGKRFELIQEQENANDETVLAVLSQNINKV